MMFFDHSILYRIVIAKGAHFKLSDVNDLKDAVLTISETTQFLHQ